MEPVNELRLHPVGDHNARQSNCARPHPRRRVKADGAGDENERSGPNERQDQSCGDNFHKGVLFLDTSNADLSEVRERQSPDWRGIIRQSGDWRSRVTSPPFIPFASLPVCKFREGGRLTYGCGEGFSLSSQRICFVRGASSSRLPNPRREPEHNARSLYANGIPK